MQWKVNGSNRAMVQIATIKYGIVVHGDLHPSTSFAPTIPTVHSCSSTLFYPFCFVLTSHCVFHKHMQWTAFTVRKRTFGSLLHENTLLKLHEPTCLQGVCGWCPLLGGKCKEAKEGWKVRHRGHWNHWEAACKTLNPGWLRPTSGRL